MSNIIKIKRKPLANGPGVPQTLQGGELAFSEADAKLYYGLGPGDPATPIEIGGSGYVLQQIKDYVPANLAYTTGNQNIGGIKTFTDGILISSTGLKEETGASFDFVGSSGNAIYVPSGTIRTKDIYIDRTLYVGQRIDISAAAEIVAQGTILYEADPFIVKGSGIFTSGLFVGPSGSPTGVSLQGHKHSYTPGVGFVDIPDFCSGVADCVNTKLIIGAGLRSDLVGSDLQISLSGQAATLHAFTGSGFLVRTSGPNNNGTFSARELSSGNNIVILNRNGLDGNPTIGLPVSLTGLTDVKSSNFYATNIYTNNGQNTLNVNAPTVNITGNLIVSDLTVTGTTTTVNSTTITVQDPVITLGGTGTITSSDTLDRGIQLRYWGGSSVATGFMGWNYSTKEFIFLESTTGTIAGNDYGAGTFGQVKVGSLISNGSISGSNIYITGATANRLAIFGDNKEIVSTGSPTLTEIGHLSGVTGLVQTQINDLTTALAGSSTIVRTTGTQTISGVKTFSDLSVFSGVGINTGAEAPSGQLHVKGTGYIENAYFKKDNLWTSPSLEGHIHLTSEIRTVAAGSILLSELDSFLTSIYLANNTFGGYSLPNNGILMYNDSNGMYRVSNTISSATIDCGTF